MAHHLLPSERNIALEYAEALVESAQWKQLIEWLDQLPKVNEPRLHLVRACAQLKLGHLDAVEAFLESGFELPDLREGDHVLTDLWTQWMAKRGIDPIKISPPASIDFRMQ